MKGQNFYIRVFILSVRKQHLSCPALPPQTGVWVAVVVWGGRAGRGGGDDAHMADILLEAVRGMWLAHPDLGHKPLLAKLREQQLDLGAATKEVREALVALKAESEATEAAAAPPTADQGGAPSSSVAPSLACFGPFNSVCLPFRFTPRRRTASFSAGVSC